MLTNWGYEVDGNMPPIMTVAEFQAATGGVMSSTPEQIEWALAAVSQTIRDYCGWHVAPVLTCKHTGDGRGRFLQLPCMGVVSVDAVAVAGATLAQGSYQWTGAGLIRLNRGCFPDVWRGVVVEYKAGYTLSGALQAVAVQMASNALAAAPGVASEQAGQVRIDYNRTSNGVSGGVALLDRDAAMLDAYKIAQV